MTMSPRERVEHGRAIQERDEPGDRCRSCRALVEWTVTTGGKRMPLDPTPVATGNVRKTGRTIGASPEVEYVEVSSLFVDQVDEDRYTSHFATCPQADEWRRRKRGAR